ncbi:hypothetical protein BDK51DRAFT_42484 [Blyttiomyces helicus]|uniref:Uncharacterized protein n=1 Tax=Blyttiomyces helicus TaxID=388810 RepID=A0A4P9W1X4_9FUNG|nr:hypothetical protein BDK51DRAFT_42484 [Blyttiomyces helicus]|eukprot:RKO84076.1 hypothetical protein BDK51DRAFT_42484 [Blyttiomyces helicus]
MHDTPGLAAVRWESELTPHHYGSVGRIEDGLESSFCAAHSPRAIKAKELAADCEIEFIVKAGKARFHDEAAPVETPRHRAVERTARLADPHPANDRTHPIPSDPSDGGKSQAASRLSHPPAPKRRRKQSQLPVLLCLLCRGPPLISAPQAAFPPSEFDSQAILPAHGSLLPRARPL